MTKLELTGRIDAIRLDLSKRLDDRTVKLPPKERSALKEVLDLLSEAADVCEEHGL